MKKKGFTLIELLAVIVILAIVALIATPMIMGVIEKARKGAAIQSVNGLLEAAEQYQIEMMLEKNPTNTIDLTSNTLNVKGGKPTSGMLIIDTLGNMSIIAKYGNYCIEKKFDEISPQIVEKEECTMEKSELESAINYKEAILNGAYPELKGNLIPVTIDSDGIVKKADLKTVWYSYEKKQWANAVILKSGETIGEDGIISEEKIQQYYVWIPRYRYQLWNVNSERKYPNGTEEPSAIQIVFEGKNTEVSNGDANGEWLTHPAFTSFDTNGIWVGKFEISYDENTFTNSTTFLTSNPNTTVATDSSKILIKPNVRSLTNKSVSEFYTLTKEMNSALNSHMIKNMEWGAIAYLTYSNYGKCTNTSCEEVYINNVNTGYYKSSPTFSGQWSYGPTVTGCSATSTSEDVAYNLSSCASGYAWNDVSNKASTTGNITGIYDMSGGSYEFFMSVLADNNNKPMSGTSETQNSGFNGTYGDGSGIQTKGIDFPLDVRYYDVYKGNGKMNDDTWWDHYQSSYLGDAVKEMVDATNYSSRLWFNDANYFIVSSKPWLLRGGGYDSYTGGGILYMQRDQGHLRTHVSTRVILSF